MIHRHSAFFLLWAAAGLALIGGCASHSTTSQDMKENAISVTLVRPERKTLTRTLKIPATVEALQAATLYAKTAGYLSLIAVDRGDHVRKYQVLAEISSPEMVKDRDVVEAQLRQAEAERKLQQITADRLQAVQRSDSGAVTQQQIDEAQGKLEFAEATMSRLKAELARANALLDYATIKAPFEGTVTDRFVDPGAMIQTSAASLGTPIITLMSLDTVRVFIDVPEPDVPFVTRKTSVRLSVSSLRDREFIGTVTRYSSALNPKTRTMKTEIDYPNADHELRPGMYGVATLELETHEGALTLPAAALLVEKDAAFVYVVVDGKAKRSPVRTGLNDGIVVEILEGLTGSESVIVGGKGTVTDGSSVRPGSQG